jgi:hypothetical protein
VDPPLPVVPSPFVEEASPGLSGYVFLWVGVEMKRRNVAGSIIVVMLMAGLLAYLACPRWLRTLLGFG